MNQKVARLTDANFKQQVTDSPIPVLVEFWASWCLPCRAVEPILAELAAEYDGRIKIAKLQVDQNPKTAALHKIGGVPTFAIFQGGKIIWQGVGAHSKAQLQRRLEQVL